MSDQQLEIWVWVIAISILVAVIVIAWQLEDTDAKRAYGRRAEWKPKTPDDCPLCRQAYAPSSATLFEVTPWKQGRSKRGVKKRFVSDGFACPNPECRYFGCTVSSIHALVSDGFRGKAERIHRWHCQCCGTGVSERWNTPMRYLKTPSHRVSEVLTALAEGVDESAAHRIFHHDRRTIARWLARSGDHAQRLHDLFFRHLRCAHLQLDELVTKLRGRVERVWVWAAIDAQTKIIPQIHIGRRTADDAQAFIHRLKQRLLSISLPAFSSDGLRSYFSALTAHFGFFVEIPGRRKPVWIVDPRLLFAQLHKLRRGRKLKDIYTHVRCGTRQRWQGVMRTLGLTGTIQTAFIERVNLTFRELVAPLSRHTWSLARSEATLAHHMYWMLAYYHFSRKHRSLRVRMPNGHYRHRTPAVAAGLTHHLWHVRDIIRYPIAPSACA